MKQWLSVFDLIPISLLFTSVSALFLTWLKTSISSQICNNKKFAQNLIQSSEMEKSARREKLSFFIPALLAGMPVMPKHVSKQLKKLLFHYRTPFKEKKDLKMSYFSSLLLSI